MLPIAYTTADCISDEQFASLDDLEKMTALSRYTVVENSKQKTVKVSEMEEVPLPGLDAEEVSHDSQIQITAIKNGYRITATEGGVIRISLDPDMKNGTLYFRFQVKNHTEDPVIISANGRRNKLSGLDAPYPNENNCFSYMLKEKGRDKYISLKVSAGTYDLTEIGCYRFPTKLFQKNRCSLPNCFRRSSGIKTVCSVVRSLPERMAISLHPFRCKRIEAVRGWKRKDLEMVNTAFAGAKVTAGTHTVDLRLDPPGETYGKLASMLSVLLYAVWAAGTILQKRRLRSR